MICARCLFESFLFVGCCTTASQKIFDSVIARDGHSPGRSWIDFIFLSFNHDKYICRINLMNNIKNCHSNMRSRIVLMMSVLFIFNSPQKEHVAGSSSKLIAQNHQKNWCLDTYASTILVCQDFSTISLYAHNLVLPRQLAMSHAHNLVSCSQFSVSCSQFSVSCSQFSVLLTI